ncbi:vWA domain-containing protein [Photobacterium halotolerans]|uniref:VWA domain-containing protein n=1 Tax=Photobacterium halotolerans TaxID=265726 RepID=A0A7X4Y1L6_9GAMM|nr:VWA domain-containing protein [Photobacterium halotolerans]NAW64150.1 VWA domain-containing protein [Photobacterium halotolerans]NAW88827.1 VWA domain-containing protein [Photobacterium halotolerans]NAX49020.1 VWA domain-containing protein [Photobacterium halotolerans]
MFEFVWWWALVLLPLPWFVYRFTKPVQPVAAITLPVLPENLVRKPVRRWQSLLALLCWVCLLGALARPVWFGDPVQIQPEHRDMLLAVDLSGSMSIEDMVDSQGNTVDRLTAVKQVVTDFIGKRQGDRLGLVLFANHAYLQTPLTFDLNTVKQQLARTVLGLIGQSTAIGEGLGIAAKSFINSDAKQRVIILLSDGANTSGVINPMEAAKLAAENKVRIYTVGIGAEEMVQRSFFGDRMVNPSQDLDEHALTQIAALTDGQYFRARNPQELASIYQSINDLEPVSTAQQTWRPREELFRFPLAGALFFSVLLAIRWRRYG